MIGVAASSVPEPSGAVLLGLGITGFIVAARGADLAGSKTGRLARQRLGVWLPTSSRLRLLGGLLGDVADGPRQRVIRIQPERHRLGLGLQQFHDLGASGRQGIAKAIVPWPPDEQGESIDTILLFGNPRDQHPTEEVAQLLRAGARTGEDAVDSVQARERADLPPMDLVLVVEGPLQAELGRREGRRFVRSKRRR